MDKFWLRLVIVGFVIVGLVIGWDIFLTFSGFKRDQEYKVTDISPNLYGKVESHLRSDSGFIDFEQEALQSQTTTNP